MILGFVLVLFAVAGSIAILVFIVRSRKFTALEQQRQHAVILHPVSVNLAAASQGPFIQLQPVPTLKPDPEDEGKLRECPICFEETSENAHWLLLPCKHGVCTTCYCKLVQDQHRVTNCPFCRMPLLEPAPSQPPTDSLV